MATSRSDLLNTIRIGGSDLAIIEFGAPGGLQFKRGDTSAHINAALSVLEGADPDFEIFL